MIMYALPPTHDPDFMVVLPASQAEAFDRAAKAAVTAMEVTGHPQSSLGIMKTQRDYLAGRMEFSTGTIVETTRIDDFGARYDLTEQRVVLKDLRKQLAGPVRIGLAQATHSIGVRAIWMVLYRGGPLLLMTPDDAAPGHRIATLRFEGAKTSQEERNCVEVNRASRNAYRMLWETLSEKGQRFIPPPPVPEPNDQFPDVFDHVPAFTSLPRLRPAVVSPPQTTAPGPGPSFEEREDALDGLAHEAPNEAAPLKDKTTPSSAKDNPILASARTSAPQISSNSEEIDPLDREYDF